MCRIYTGITCVKHVFTHYHRCLNYMCNTPPNTTCVLHMCHTCNTHMALLLVFILMFFLKQYNTNLSCIMPVDDKYQAPGSCMNIHFYNTCLIMYTVFVFEPFLQMSLNSLCSNKCTITYIYILMHLV